MVILYLTVELSHFISKRFGQLSMFDEDGGMVRLFRADSPRLVSLIVLHVVFKEKGDSIELLSNARKTKYSIPNR